MADPSARPADRVLPESVVLALVVVIVMATIGRFLVAARYSGGKGSFTAKSDDSARSSRSISRFLACWGTQPAFPVHRLCVEDEFMGDTEWAWIRIRVTPDMNSGPQPTCPSPTRCAATTFASGVREETSRPPTSRRHSNLCPPTAQARHRPGPGPGAPTCATPHGGQEGDI
jgi:hypothetical protein